MKKPTFNQPLKKLKICIIVSVCIFLLLIIILKFNPHPLKKVELSTNTTTSINSVNSTNSTYTNTEKVNLTVSSCISTNTTTCNEITTCETTEKTVFVELPVSSDIIPEIVDTTFTDVLVTPVSSLETFNDFVTEEPLAQFTNSIVIPEGSESTTFQATYYMDFTLPYIGASGRDLISGYSVASNYFPFGSIVYVESDYFPSGEYRVDDCGGMANNVLDFYYLNYDFGYGAGQLTPEFKKAGRVNVKVTLIS